MPLLVARDAEHLRDEGAVHGSRAGERLSGVAEQTLHGAPRHIGKPVTVLYRAAEDFYEFTVAHRVEETLQVEVNHINVAIIDYFLSTS